jgi:hypothetical protein
MSYNVFSTAHDLTHIKRHINNPSPLPVIATSYRHQYKKATTMIAMYCTYAGLLEMIVEVLTTCHTQYT